MKTQDKSCCWLCHAKLDDLNGDPTQRRPHRTMAHYNAAVCMGDQYCSSAFSIPGVELHDFWPDWMHTSCLGILQYVMGCVAWQLILKLGGSFKRSTDARANLFVMIKVVTKRLGMEVIFGGLTITMIKPAAGKKPRMRLKAAEGRRFFTSIDMLARTILSTRK